MAMTLTSTNRTVTLPYYARNGLKELITQNFSKNYTIGGSLFVDYLNTRGGWEITFPAITVEDYNSIRSVYDDQFTNAEFLLYNDPDLGIEDMVVFMNMPNERSLDWNKQAVNNLKITLEPESASS